MEKQTVNTDGIAAAADKLQSVDKNINSMFNVLEYTSQELYSSWGGRAGASATWTKCRFS